MRILIVEDDPGIANGLLTSLRLAGCAADVCGTIAHAWSALRAEPFDAMLLDLGLPDGDGVALLARLCAVRVNTRQGLPRSDLPVLILTARDGVDDRVVELDSGADQVSLGAREFALLLTLVEARPQVLSKARLEATLYDFGEKLDGNAIEVHVHHLRRNLGESLIKTIRGGGYFVPPEDGALVAQ
jgi:DNA-binding response OmpR family regulator